MNVVGRTGFQVDVFIIKDNPDIAREYGELKLSLAKKYPDNIKKYKKGKEAFTKEIQTRALKWYRHKDVEQI